MTSDSIDQFFHDEPDLPWKPGPLAREPYQSVCYPIIGKKILYLYKHSCTENEDKPREFDYTKPMTWYYCKLHPAIESSHLESIEHHCKYKEPEEHKAKILEYLEMVLQKRAEKAKEIK